MFKFNNNHIITGQIKQLLAEFNLPKYRVYTQENQRYFDDYGIEKNIIPTVRTNRSIEIAGQGKEYKTSYEKQILYAPYIKDGKIQYYVTKDNVSSWAASLNNRPIINYSYNLKIENNTKNLKIKNNLYDSYTHEYLGDYLRFKRDYLGLDLMSMYNCFSNRVCDALNLKLFNKKVLFDTSAKNYKIYAVPVKLFKTYTIAMDSSDGIEVCCGFYGKYYYSKSVKVDANTADVSLEEKTYKKYNRLVFAKPELYDILTNLPADISIPEVAQNEHDLKLFIKVPINNASSIVILEGDYRNYNDSIVSIGPIAQDQNQLGTLCRKQNMTITNFNTEDSYYIYGDEIIGTKHVITNVHTQDFSEFKPITALQLLRSNTKVSYPFADRLLEYLFENAITSEEEIADNIKRVNEVISLNTTNGIQSITVWDKQTRTFKTAKGYLNGNLAPKHKGIWTDAIRPILYERFNLAVDANRNDTNHDILGYVDKDVEQKYIANSGIVSTKTGKPTTISIAEVDLYTEDK